MEAPRDKLGLILVAQVMGMLGGHNPGSPCPGCWKGDSFTPRHLQRTFTEATKVPNLL